jgi:cytochrome oxidase Cu insertion factor (SCO1/SenC/PrrC family)
MMTLLMASLLLFAPPEGARQQRQQGTLKVGDAAPAFSLQDLEGKQTVRLEELKGKPVVLIFGSCS